MGQQQELGTSNRSTSKKTMQLNQVPILVSSQMEMFIEGQGILGIAKIHIQRDCKGKN